MPYPAGHRVEVKRSIIDSARGLFNRFGFDNVSIGQIMAGADLTHGGFYSYFKSKSDLYAEVLGCFFTDPNWKNCWKGVHVISHPRMWVHKLCVRIYLASISRMLRTHVLWRHCRATSHVAAKT